MRVVMFVHSLVSDWNHGNAHFLRGVAAELIARGHEVAVYEPRDAGSVADRGAEHGEGPIAACHAADPTLRSTRYDARELELDAALDGADLVLVHEWSDHGLVRRIGEHRARGGGYRLLFHDTHHRSVSDAGSMAAYDLEHYDGVLAFGEVIRERYVARGWARRAWSWHEAADTRVFRPLDAEREGDLVWIGNWGDEERTAELREFLLDPVAGLGLRARAHGVRYPEAGQRALAAAGIAFRGWIPNHRVPEAFARHAVTVHIPRRPYVEALPGIPTIRVFEALACGIPLVCAPWDDAESLFTPGRDYLVARDGAEMRRRLREVLYDEDLARALREQGLATIRARHTCGHRVEELMGIVREFGSDTDADTDTGHPTPRSDGLGSRRSVSVSLSVPVSAGDIA